MISERGLIWTLFAIAAFFHIQGISDAAELPDREPPLLEIAVQKVLHARDFGAIPDDGEDDLPAILNALEAALKTGVPTELRFERGRYDLFGAPEKSQPLIKITRARDFVFNGNGADFIAHDTRQKFISVFNDNERVILKKFTLDYRPRPVSQGHVIALDKKNVTMRVEFDADFPDLDNGFFERGTKWAIIKDRDNPRRTKTDMPSIWEVVAWESVGPHTYDIKMADWRRDHFDRVEVGDPYVAVNRSGGGFFTFRSRQVTWMDVRIYTSGGLGWLDMRNSLINYIRCRIIPPDGYWHATGADGIYCLRARAGPWIEGCEFDALGDDALSIKTFGANCLRKIDDRTLVLKGRPGHDEGRDAPGPPFPMMAGDLLRAFDPAVGEYLGEARVVSFKRLPDAKGGSGPFEVTVDRPLPRLTQGTDWQSHIVYNDDTRGAGFVVRDNIFRNIRRWGFNCQARDGLVEGNQFIACQDQAIILHNADVGHHASDGFAARNVVIRNNVFDDCCHVFHRGRDMNQGMVSSLIRGTTDRRNRFFSSLGRWQGIENITIEGNTFRNWLRAPALFIGNARNFVVRDNEFVSGGGATPAIRIRNSSGVTVEGNRLRGPWHALDEAILVDTESVRDTTLERNEVMPTR